MRIMILIHFFPLLVMADNGSGGMNAIVAIVAVIAIAIVGYFAVMMLQGDGGGAGINVEIPTTGGGGQ